MVAVPPCAPHTTPLMALTVATKVLLLLQVPPRVVSAKVMACPWQTTEGPVMTEEVVTTTGRMALHAEVPLPIM